MARMEDDETYDLSQGKGQLVDVGVRFTRESANDLAATWRKGSALVVRVYHRRVKADGVTQPVYLVVKRARLDPAQHGARRKEATA